MAEVLQHKAGLFGAKLELHMAPEGLTLVGRMGPGSVEFAPLAEVTDVSLTGAGRKVDLVILFGTVRPAWALMGLPVASGEWAAAVIGEVRFSVSKAGRREYARAVPIEGISDLCAQTVTTGDGHAAVDLADLLLMQGVHHGASDVHFDPYGDAVVVRYRLDGILRDVARLDPGIKLQLTSRLKVLSRLATFKKSVAQEGRAAVRVGERTVDFRFSAIPTIHGEKIAARIFDPATSVFEIDDLGMSAGMLSSFKSLLMQPQGTILLTGPAGSGKTTTMYGALTHLRANRKNLSSVATVEDPVEYDLRVVNQTQVNTASGLTFANALRTVLRQDPEVIMIGEIRDRETADIAVQAGLTGHMILSTVHARSAAGVLLRLVDLGVEPYLLASSVTAILSQRLVRKVCGSCAREHEPTQEERDKFRLRGDDRFVAGAGCEKCSNTGYSGRTGIFQLLPVTDDMRELVIRRAPLTVLDEQVERETVPGLVDDGLEKASIWADNAGGAREGAGMTPNGFAMAVARGVWTTAAVGAVWVIATERPGPSPGWITWFVVGVIVTTWAVMMVLLGDSEDFARSVVWFCVGAFSGSVFLMRIAPEGGPDWTLVPLCAAAAAWIALVWLRVSMKWSLVLMAMAVAFFCPALLVLPIITIIGVGKLVIMVAGRRAAVARSRLRATSPAASPRGLVEHCDYD